VASGVTDAEGKFRLSTFGNHDGAMPGTHAVAIVKSQPTVTGEGMTPDDMSGDYGRAMMQAAKAAKVKTDLPEKYANAGTSGLTAEVTKSGPNEFTFDLQ
jgi:hypothetical protein